MKLHTTCFALLLAVLLLVPGGMAFGQKYAEQIMEAKKMLEENPVVENRMRLGTLQYQEGSDILRAGDVKKALEMFQASVWTFEDSGGQIPENSVEFQEARYGLAYTLIRDNNPHEAVLVLNQVLKANPNYTKASYLLGVTLLTLPGDNVSKGLQVLSELSQGNSRYKQVAGHAATRYGYNLSTLAHANGKAGDASEMVAMTRNAVGRDMGAFDDENDMMAFANGVYLSETADVFGALEEFEAVQASNPEFDLANGVTLRDVLANTYYEAGRSQLESGGESGGVNALEMFEKSGSLKDPNALDLRHGRAAAYALTGDQDSAKREADAIKEADPEYFEKYKKEIEIKAMEEKKESSS